MRSKAYRWLRAPKKLLTLLGLVAALALVTGLTSSSASAAPSLHLAQSGSLIMISGSGFSPGKSIWVIARTGKTVMAWTRVDAQSNGAISTRLPVTAGTTGTISVLAGRRGSIAGGSIAVDTTASTSPTTVPGIPTATTTPNPTTSPSTTPTSATPISTTPTSTSTTLPGPVQAADLATYKTYLNGQAALLTSQTAALDKAIHSGNLAAAKAAYVAARAPYKRLWPVVGGDTVLDTSIEGQELTMPTAQWAGFHPIEKGLFLAGSTQGLGPLADQLSTAVVSLQTRMTTANLHAGKIANEMDNALNNVTQFDVYGEEDKYSGLDVGDAVWTLQGSQVAFKAITSSLPANYASQINVINNRFATANNVLAKYTTAGGVMPYSALKPADTTAIAQAISGLAEPLSYLPPVLPGDAS